MFNFCYTIKIIIKPSKSSQIKENKIEIKGNRAEDVEIVNKNGELKVRMSINKLLDGEEIKAKIYFKNLYSIEVNEGSFITSDEIFNQTAISLSAKEGAEIRLKLAVQKLKTRAISGGIIKIECTATNQDVSIGKGGILEAENLDISFFSLFMKIL